MRHESCYVQKQQMQNLSRKQNMPFFVAFFMDGLTGIITGRLSVGAFHLQNC